MFPAEKKRSVGESVAGHTPGEIGLDCVLEAVRVRHIKGVSVLHVEMRIALTSESCGEIAIKLTSLRNKTVRAKQQPWPYRPISRASPFPRIASS